MLTVLSMFSVTGVSMPVYWFGLLLIIVFAVNLGCGAAIFLAVLAFNLMGDGLRDALDPRLVHEGQTGVGRSQRHNGRRARKR